MVLCNPSNPTGAVLDPDEGRRIVSELARRDIVVFSDETYLQFVYDRPHWSAASAADWRRNVVVVGTFSKSFGMMGWRVGFLLADAAVCAEAVKIQDAMIICAPVISQMAALGAVSEDWTYPESFHPELSEAPPGAHRRPSRDSAAALDSDKRGVLRFRARGRVHRFGRAGAIGARRGARRDDSRRGVRAQRRRPSAAVVRICGRRARSRKRCGGWQRISRGLTEMPFKEIIGHRRLVALLSRAIAQDTLPQSLLFAGPRGVGKRRTAVALAETINCLAAGARPLRCRATRAARARRAGASPAACIRTS